MPTLVEELHELANLMEEGTPLERDLEARVGKLITDYEALGDKLTSTKMVNWGGGRFEAEGFHLLNQVWGEFAKWVDTNFRINATNTPRGGKPVKEAWKRFAYDAKAGVGYSGADSARQGWERFKPMVPEMVKLFSATGGNVIREIKTANATYINGKGLAAASFKKYIQALDAMFSAMKGWRRKALGNGLKVNLAGSEAFRGTSKGKYNEASDTLFVRATPKVMSRSGGYGSPEYILIHELGHRYEKMHHIGDRFERAEWITTPYSMTDSMAGSEKFAELFALGHFGIRNAHREFGDVVDRFEKEMP